MKIHCSSLVPKIPTTTSSTLPSTSSNPPSPKGQQSSSREEGDHHQDSEEDIMDSSQEPQLTKLECVNPHHDDSLRLLDLGSGPELDTQLMASSVQMSPASSSTDMVLYPGRGPLSDVSYVYTMSPPDLLSPPLSTSDPCLSPGSSLSGPAHSPPHQYSLSSHTQSFATTDNEPHNHHKSESMKHKAEQSDNCQTLDTVMTASSQQHNHVTTSDNINNQENNQQQHCEEETISSFLSSSGSTCSNQPAASCINCSPKNCSCNEQSKLKQLFNPQPQQLSSFDSKQSVTSFHQDENLMKLIENHDGKNAKESMKTEPQELLSNAPIISDNVTPAQNQFTISGSRSTCALPSDIPTLESLSRTSPKLSTWRQTRIISEKLEQHLWTWRCACKKSGKRISKSLLQARAKWAFRKAGIVEFKVLKQFQIVRPHI